MVWLPNQVGVGTSRLQEDMVKDGYMSIMSVDYSRVAIDRMREVHKGYSELSYQVADSRHESHTTQHSVRSAVGPTISEA